MAHILIVDDDTLFCEMLVSAMELQGHVAAVAHSVTEGMALLQTQRFEVALLDVRLPDGNGLDMLNRMRELPEAPEAVMITAAGDPDGAELAINSGAWDYLQKPASIEAMSLAVDRALGFRNRRLRLRERVLDVHGIVGHSARLRTCLDALGEAAHGDGPVLISGETGTGKELFARAIHANSVRAQGPFVAVDCGALSRTLVESELFGHQRGAFTGAVESRQGLFKQADKGTLFLDEVGELPMPQQRAFLRVLQEHRFRPLGSKVEMESDFRLVAATNRDLREMVERGTFRKDLYFRLQGVLLPLPPLRERSEDVSELVRYHADRLCERYGFAPKGFAPEVVHLLEGYGWPGNVRELVHVVGSMLLAARDEAMVLPDHLPLHLRAHMARSRIRNEDAAPEASVGAHGESDFVSGAQMPLPAWKDYRDDVVRVAERRYLCALLRACNGNVTRAGSMAGLSRQRLHALLRKHGLVRQWNTNEGMQEYTVNVKFTVS